MPEALLNGPPDVHPEESGEVMQPQNLPPETLSSALPEQNFGPPSPALGVETAPFYTLNEDEIRARIADAVREKPLPKKAPKHIWRESQIQPVGLEEDIEKARLMAEAEHPYRLASLAKFDEAEDVIGTMKLKEQGTKSKTAWFLQTTAVNPIKMAKAGKKVWDALDLEARAWSAAQIVGSSYDRMLAAAQPFAQKLDVLDILPSPQTQTESAPKEHLSETRISPEAEALVGHLRLDNQLAEQVTVLHRSGVIEQLSSGGYGVKRENGQEYPSPTPQQIRQLVDRNLELASAKAGQGFTRLLVVPDVVPSEKLAASLQDRAVAHFHEGNLHDTSGEAVDLDKFYKQSENKPFDLVQHPRDVKDVEGATYTDKISKDTQKTTESTDDESVTPGWKVVLVKNMPELPRTKKDMVSLGGRSEFITAATTSPKLFLELFANWSASKGEHGMTLNAWYSYALTELEREGTLVDSESDTFLFGSYVPGALFTRRRRVPTIGWNFGYKPDKKTPHKIALQVASTPLRFKQQGVGARTMVELK